MNRDDDPDYRCLRKWAIAHDAPAWILSKLERLIDRAGIHMERERREVRTEKPKPSRLDFLLPEAVRVMAQTMTQKQIAEHYGIAQRDICNFMGLHKIKPSYKGIGAHMQREVVTVRDDPAFPVPVHVIAPGYNAASFGQ